jgi:hypothetical protein
VLFTYTPGSPRDTWPRAPAKSFKDELRAA